jgi:hypothetical protein
MMNGPKKKEEEKMDSNNGQFSRRLNGSKTKRRESKDRQRWRQRAKRPPRRSIKEQGRRVIASNSSVAAASSSGSSSPFDSSYSDTALFKDDQEEEEENVWIQRWRKLEKMEVGQLRELMAESSVPQYCLDSVFEQLLGNAYVMSALDGLPEPFMFDSSGVFNQYGAVCVALSRHLGRRQSQRGPIRCP